MSIPPIQSNQTGPIIRTPIDQESRRVADVAPQFAVKRLSTQALAAPDSFEPTPTSSPQTSPNAQLRRVAAQQQASYLAPPPTPPAESSGLFSEELLAAPPSPLPPTPPSNPTPLPGVIETPVDSPEVAPLTPGQDAPAPEAPEAPPTPPSKSRTFNQDDLASLQSIFGKTAGEEGFNASYDLNSDGVINGADLASLLARFERPATPASKSQPATEPVKLTSQQLLDGVLKHLGGKVKGEQGVYDVNGDGLINGGDIAQVLAQWDNASPASGEQGAGPSKSRTLHSLLTSIGAVAGDASYSRALDLNADGAINGADLADYLASLRTDEETA